MPRRPSRFHRARRATAAFVAVVVALITGSGRAAAAIGDDDRAGPTAVTYLPPVDAPVVDRFRPPTTPYGPGNRGIDYATAPGQPVSAAAPGEVVFAGRVGNGLHVVVRHADGIRTSYSFLGGITVERGDHVDQGTVLGRAADDGTPLHFGARAGTDDDDGNNGNTTYLDPLVLLGQVAAGQEQQPHAHLVADPHPDRPLTEAEERHLLSEALRGVGHATGQAAGWLRARVELTVDEKLQLARILLDDAIDLSVPVPVYLVIATLRWNDEQATCTPATTPVPPPSPTRRIVVLVGGLGSSADRAAILGTDTGALGYAPDDVHQFSYRSDTKPYTTADTQQDLDVAAERLAEQITTIQRANPGTPVDVIAHSQGGLVARAAVVLHHARPALLATLGTPHHGADLATAARSLDLTSSGSVALDAASLATEGAAGLDLDSRSIQQLGETSPFLRRLDDAPLPPPDQTTTLSIAVRGDHIVPNHQSRLDPPADNAVITTTGSLNEHSGLPAADATTTELRRALAGQHPTCRSLTDALADEAIGRQTADLEDQVGVFTTAGALYFDARGKPLLRSPAQWAGGGGADAPARPAPPP